MKKILWVSRHAPVSSQVAELRRLFGGDCEIIRDVQPFADAHDIARRIAERQADELVVVAPLAVLQALTELGLRPLWAEMELLDCSDPRVEVRAEGLGTRAGRDARCYRFVRFRRVRGVTINFEEV